MTVADARDRLCVTSVEPGNALPIERGSMSTRRHTLAPNQRWEEGQSRMIHALAGAMLLALLAVGLPAFAAEESPATETPMTEAPATETPATEMPAGEPPATESLVTIPSEGYDIVGTLALPTDATGPVPAVLMLHGYGSSADEVGDMYGRLADALAAVGIGSLRIDFAGMGASPGSTLDLTYDTMIGDASKALDWLSAQESVDAARIGVQGFSLGSLIGAHLVGTDSRPMAFASWSGAIVDGGPTAGPEAAAECEATGEGHIEVDLGFRTIDHSCEFFTSMAASTALTDFAPFAGALLLVAGSDDTVVDPSVSENASTTSASEDVTLEIIEGADHIYHVLTEDQTLAEEAIALTADWFAEKL
jgi:dienelactone hydrolase